MRTWTGSDADLIQTAAKDLLKQKVPPSLVAKGDLRAHILDYLHDSDAYNGVADEFEAAIADEMKARAADRAADGTGTDTTYRIVRFYRDGRRGTIRCGLTFGQAEAHLAGYACPIQTQNDWFESVERESAS